MMRREYSERLTIAAQQNIKEKEFWLNRLSGELVKTRFPYDYSEVEVGEPPGDSLVFTLTADEEFSAQLKQLSKGSDYTLNLILVAALVVLLHKYTGSTDITVGTPIYKQDNQGDFINTVLVLRNPIDTNKTFKEIILQVRQTITDAVAHQNYPMEILLESLFPQTENPGYGFPLFDVAILLENIHHRQYLEHIPCNIIFSFGREEQGNGITGTVSYNSSLYERNTIERIGDHFINVLQQTLFNPGVLISQIQMVTEAKKNQLLYDFNDTKARYPRGKMVHQRFEEQVEKTPHHIAVSFPLDLSDIYHQLESPIIKPGLMEKMGKCCFKQNSYIYQSPLNFPAGNLSLVLLKTNRHNSVIVNSNIRELLGFFNGKANLESIYSRVKEIERLKDIKPRFLVYPMSQIDLLEVAFQFDQSPEVFSLDGFTDFVRLVQFLYRVHLLQLAGISDEAALLEGSSGTGFEDGEHPPGIPGVEELVFGAGGMSTGQVLLLGDTPGMPSTGLLYLASYLKRNGIDAYCQFYDPSGDYTSMKQNLELLLERIQPRIVAISLKWFLYIARVIDMAAIIKEYAGKNSLEIKTVVGGNTASYYAEEIITYDCIDYLVRGDGEVPLHKICQGEDEAYIPNLSYKRDGKILENPITYTQDETDSPGIYLSHLEEILLSDHVSRFGTFFIYTHKGCGMNCLYCGGCSRVQQEAFNRKKVLRRGIEEVRRDIQAAKNQASTFQFDFDIPDKNLLDYCRQTWEGIDLTGHFCIFSTLTPPTPGLVELVSKTFKYVYWDFDITTLSERHRHQLDSLELVKPQPSDADILAFMALCQDHHNIEVRLNLITGLPYFNIDDIEPGEKLLAKIMNSYSCFGGLHWARLHAQPGAPIVRKAGKHHMHSYATTFKDFLKFSRENFNPDSPYPFVEALNYPYIYFEDDRLNSRVSNFYREINITVDQHRKDRQKSLIICDTLTYKELNEKVDALASILKAKGAGSGEIIGLMLERSIDIPMGILAILKVGCAYMPIDPEFPPGRIEYMLKDSSAKALVTTRALVEEGEKVGRWEGETILLQPANAFSPSSTLTLTSTCQVSPTNLAYVIYTSGTTGKPKGVLLTHENLVNYVHWFSTTANLTAADKTLLTSSFAFDLGYTSLYTSILNGGQLYVLPREVYLLAERLLDYITREKITYLKLTPALFSIIVNSPGFSPEKCKTLRVVAIGGEAINVKDIETAHSHCPHLRVMNHYGPTEATIGSVATFIDFHRFEDYKIHPVIGKPIHNTYVHILDRDVNLLPVGVPGELCISGTCLARGYLNQPELTAEKFLPIFNRSSRSYKSYIYRTGDRARWLPDGTVEFLGRIDSQVKVRGYRVELGEIENRLLKHQRIENAVVVVKEAAKEADKYLCAYIVTTAKKIDNHAGKRLEPPKIDVSKEFEEEDPGNSLSLVSRFEEAAGKNPDQPAVKSHGRVLSYGSLNDRANRVARKISQEYDDRYRLSKNERIRYKRQMLLHGWGLAFQEKLKSTTVFVAGAGGGASPTITQLALLGFGTIKICDFDEIELSNLNRQFIHDQERLGMNKALSARITVNRTNPNVNVIPYTQKLTRENVFELVGDSDIIFDMFDGPADKFILSECAVVKKIPHVIISMADLNAYSLVCHTPHTPCYHCIFDKEKLETIVSGMKNYVENYSKNPLAVAATSLFISTGTAINEVLKILMGTETPAYNQFFYFNQRGTTKNFRYTPSYQSMTHLFSEHFREISKEQGFDWEVGWRGNLLEVLDIEANPGCPLCGTRAGEKRDLLEKRMKKAKETPLSIDVNREAELKEKDKDRKKTVAILVNHGIEMAAAITAAMKAGKTCVPFDHTTSMDNLIEMLVDSEARIILTDSDHFSLAEKLRDKVNKNIKVVEMDSLDEPGVPGEDSPGKSLREKDVDPRQKAYILYPPHLNTSPEFNRSTRELISILAKGNGPYVFTNDLNHQSRVDEADMLSAELRDYLLEELPDYMIPSFFVPLDNLPLTPNGKVNTGALPDPETGTGTGVGIIPPGNEVEEKLAGVWAEILGVKKDTIGIDTNFFESGGHSLNAAVMVAKVHKELNMKLSLAEVFEMPTLKELASLISVVYWTSGENQNPGIRPDEEEITI